jgi:tetratricopeptide (TPR) repeat protein
MNKGALAFRRTRFGEAASAWQQASHIFEQSLGPESGDFAASLGNVGIAYLSQGKAAEAEPLFRRSLTINEKVWGENHPELSVDLNNLGAACTEQKSFERLNRSLSALWFFEKRL